MKPVVPAYFDFLIEAFQRGRGSRDVHLGYWEGGQATLGPGEFTRGQEKLNTVLLGMADLAPGQCLLDVGCGLGGTLEHINTGFQSMHLTGLNIDHRQLGICGTLAPQNGNCLEWIDGDACALPFPDSSFERVLCVEAMFHFASRRRFFAEAARVLKPGGLLVASDILLLPAVASLPVPGFCIVAALCDGYGPWPDVWGKDADHRELARAVGMECQTLMDATLATRPSHRFTVPAYLDASEDPQDPTLRSGLMLKWLHEHALLQYLCMSFLKVL